MKRVYQFFFVRSDHMNEVENEKFWDFFENYGINHNYSALRTPQKKWWCWEEALCFTRNGL